MWAPESGCFLVPLDLSHSGSDFPPHPFLWALANGHELFVNQFTPNYYFHINSFVVLCNSGLNLLYLLFFNIIK